ncbi:MAG: adenylosuccinate lyase, partial [Clostridiales bacterium]|nr:adenylosuccinate lyase [Clostridiales bacterium]
VHSVAAGAAVKEQGMPNDLIARIAGDPLFGLTENEIRAELDPVKYIGRAPEQVTEFLEAYVKPLFEGETSLICNVKSDLKV